MAAAVRVSGQDQRGVDLIEIEAVEAGVVAIGERAATWNQRAIVIHAERLELPLAGNPFQVADVFTACCEYLVDAGVELAKRQGM